MLEVKVIALILVALVVDYILSKRELKEDNKYNAISQKVIENTMTLSGFTVSVKLFLLGLMCGAIVYTKDTAIIITEMEAVAWVSISFLTAVPLLYQFIGSNIAYSKALREAYHSWVTSNECAVDEPNVSINSFKDKNTVGKVIVKTKMEEHAFLKKKATHLIYRIAICIIISI